LSQSDGRSIVLVNSTYVADKVPAVITRRWLQLFDLMQKVQELKDGKRRKFVCSDLSYQIFTVYIAHLTYAKSLCENLM
jgi:hypothetical protein